MEDVPGVTVIHDVHAWTVTSGYVSLTAHVLADPDHVGEYDDMLRELRRIANEEHGIAHTTVQLETSVRGYEAGARRRLSGLEGAAAQLVAHRHHWGAGH